MDTNFGEAAESHLDADVKSILGKVANTIRHLSIDAIQHANSGHPGLPLGCAELGAYLYGHVLRHNPKNPLWANRDRFILSAGHGSALLYSCLHLSGFDLSLEDVKSFRQLHAKTPGHPEYSLSHGIETTSGPLGQGIANGVGQALGLKVLAEKFNTEDHTIFDSKVFVLAGDGCFMEGINHEACSLAGHLCLDNLVVLYDSNKICLDGPLSETCSEDTKKRFESYGWEVYTVDGYDFDAMNSCVETIRSKQQRPALVLVDTIIGKGSPSKAGTHKVHGSPLGDDEVSAVKESLGLPAEDFFVPQAVKNFFADKLDRDAKKEAAWNETFVAWKAENPDLFHEFESMSKKILPESIENKLKALEMKSPLAGRKASHAVVNMLTEMMPYIYGGSADLSCSDMTMFEKFGVIASGNFGGRNIKYGVREFAMGAIATGLAQTTMILPFCGTFLVFSDYMRNAIRLAAMQKLPVIYQFTHDSVFLGEDGPTHQPVEHLASLRAMPGLYVIRPADNNEVKMSWLAALRHEGPTALILSRQSLPLLEGTGVGYDEGVGRGAYIVEKEEEGPIDFTFFATGSEVSLAINIAAELRRQDKNVRIVSMPCWELFEKQPAEYKASVVGGDIGKRVSFEAGSDMGWHRYVGSDGITISVEGFGTSAPMHDIAGEYGFTVESILDRIL
ncbi:MAG: transketolase [Waddliaceae bacterium]|nr:transketolase [Waddliaceae bacterium]MBT3579429.1 transketolase [Waddliaceae bacterium]MBT4445182.1 transketolase [Waddliaceae bacterium]MBT6928153.1 transketolase [Waddliaceae bacterium]MBT7264486.1 transketolase [Waddliaceae bacterium]